MSLYVQHTRVHSSFAWLGGVDNNNILFSKFQDYVRLFLRAFVGCSGLQKVSRMRDFNSAIELKSPISSKYFFNMFILEDVNILADFYIHILFSFDKHVIESFCH